jgi:hypothetical protein
MYEFRHHLENGCVGHAHAKRIKTLLDFFGPAIAQDFNRKDNRASIANRRGRATEAALSRAMAR